MVSLYDDLVSGRLHKMSDLLEHPDKSRDFQFSRPIVALRGR